MKTRASGPPAHVSILLAGAALPRTKPAGEGWDALDGAPDLSVWIKGSGQVLFRSPVAQDTYEYEYNSLALPSVDVEQDPVLTITLADSDLSDDDLAARWTLSLLKLQDLPAEGLAVPLEDHGAHVSLWVRPVD